MRFAMCGLGGYPKATVASVGNGGSGNEQRTSYQRNPSYALTPSAATNH